MKRNRAIAGTVLRSVLLAGLALGLGACTGFGTAPMGSEGGSSGSQPRGSSACGPCRGSGRCGTCNGTGRFLGSGQTGCSTCSSSGVCINCGGRGQW